MSNHANQKTINSHHSQVNSAKLRKQERADNRRLVFEVNRMNIKARIEGEKQALFIAALVCFMGFVLIAGVFVYFVGGMVYG